MNENHARTRRTVAQGIATAMIAVCAVGFVAPAANASQTLYCPRGQYCAWEDDLKQGKIFNTNATFGYVGDGWNDRFSSLENNTTRTVTYYQHAYGTGSAPPLSAGTSALQLQYEWQTGLAGTWNDQISSVTVF
ncbi:peptidase inhibitor family I36 protein [Microbacteriaceae bacterium VKM Ac-2855]|nr:peptidase inhibitor family I36 protein [Microbacteriaceae bacterium VKM Ac-2855]